MNPEPNSARPDTAASQGPGPGSAGAEAPAASAAPTAPPAASTRDIVLSITRYVLTGAVALLVQRGQLDVEDANTLVGLVLGVIVLTWSLLAKRAARQAAAIR